MHGLRLGYRPHRPEAQLFVKIDPVSGLDTEVTRCATPEDRARIAADVAEFEPALRAGATHEIDTTAPAPEVVARLERIAAES